MYSAYSLSSSPEMLVYNKLLRRKDLKGTQEQRNELIGIEVQGGGGWRCP